MADDLDRAADYAEIERQTALMRQLYRMPKPEVRDVCACGESIEPNRRVLCLPNCLACAETAEYAERIRSGRPRL